MKGQSWGKMLSVYDLPVCMLKGTLADSGDRSLLGKWTNDWLGLRWSEWEQFLQIQDSGRTKAEAPSIGSTLELNWGLSVQRASASIEICLKGVQSGSRALEKPDLDPQPQIWSRYLWPVKRHLQRELVQTLQKIWFLVELYLDMSARFWVLRVNYSNWCFLSRFYLQRLIVQNINYCGKCLWEAAKGMQARPQLKSEFHWK